MPTILNATILNGQGLLGWLEGPPAWEPKSGGNHLDVAFDYPAKLWPWSGYLALYLRVAQSGTGYRGTAEGVVSFTVVSPPGKGETQERRSKVRRGSPSPVRRRSERRRCSKMFGFRHFSWRLFVSRDFRGLYATFLGDLRVQDPTSRGYRDRKAGHSKAP